jgi:hypothetical protein
MSASNLSINLVSSQPPILASHYRQPLKKHRRIFESYKKLWNTLESSFRESMNPIQTRKPRRPMIISTSQSVKGTLTTYNMPDDFMLPRATLLLSQKADHLQAPHTSQGLSLWLALQDPAPLLPFPLMRKESMPNRASLPAMIITVPFIKVQRTIPGIHKDLSLPPILEGLPTAASTTWSHHFPAIPTTMNRRGHRNLS